MIRFILERQSVDMNLDYNERNHFTLDITVPELEQALLRGGSGPMGFDKTRLLGIEILQEQHP